ncbi:hypothetical protein K474DRAFT_1710585 [Panus rudis PR-1116 ss-1]|nr:hypothetical protein K474DRAFT_1710585 [Panus rudis PR-1116 ss-1]
MCASTVLDGVHDDDRLRLVVPVVVQVEHPPAAGACDEQLERLGTHPPQTQNINLNIKALALPRSRYRAWPGCSPRLHRTPDALLPLSLASVGASISHFHALKLQAQPSAPSSIPRPPLTYRRALPQGPERIPAHQPKGNAALGMLDHLLAFAPAIVYASAIST